MPEAIDLTGVLIGKLTAIRPTKQRKSGHIVWELLCSCGRTVYVSTNELTGVGKTTSCGCSRWNDLTGVRFGRLIVVEATNERRYKNIVWRCLCDCGNVSYVSAPNLINGYTKSCGCLKIDLAKSKKGPLNPRWNKNLTDEERERKRSYPEYIEWRKAVYGRDNYTCQKCGDSSGGNLNAHHIEGHANNPGLRIDLGNGVTLCKECHDNYHHLYGRNHATREKFEEWMEKE